MKYFFILFGTFAISTQILSQTPNILLIIADDLGIDYSNGYHNSNLLPTTPTLDSLRMSGIQFNNVWSAPKCTPSRATVMSGKHGVKTGVLGSPGDLALTHNSIFKAISDSTNNAYSGAVIGKWHISQPADPFHPSDHGVDYYTGLLSAVVSNYYAWEHTHNGTTTTNNDYATSVLTDSAIHWVNQQTQPWFLWFAHVAPHGPYHVPPTGMYSIPNTANNARKYVAMIEAMDFEINRLLNNIPQNELNNTIIIFIGDNGTPNLVLQNYPSDRGKSTLYQGGIHVPMIVTGAGVSRVGEQEDALIHITDIYATLMEMTGAQLSGGIYNSLSFKHLLDNSNGETRDYNYSEVLQDTLDHYTIRNDRYKLIHSNINGTQEFYDLLNDEYELNDLIITGLNPSQQAIKEDLEQEANQRRQSWSCKDHIKNGDETGIDCGGTYCSPCSTVGVSDFNNNTEHTKIFPNPANNLLKVYCPVHGYQIEIMTVSGKKIMRRHAKGNMEVHDISSLSKGIYFVQITSPKNDVIFRDKLVKQ